MWDLSLICDMAAAGLERRARELDAEQSPLGIDCLKELELHTILRHALAAPLPDGSRFTVLAEQRFPADRAKPKRSEGERCDIVLLPPISPDGGATPVSGGTSGSPRRGSSSSPEDPSSPWHRRLLDPLEAGTLFASHGVPPDHALWIEVKVAAQFALIDGIARPNPSYASTLLRDVPADARKLARDSILADAARADTGGGALLVIIFNADEPTATHDLEAWRARAIEKSWPLAAPFTRTFPITDRIGNATATVLLNPVRPA